MRITIDGQLAPGVTAKDLALYQLARFGSGGGAGHIVEYAGPAVCALDVEARLTLCNMATEFAAFSAIVAPDEKVFGYLEGRRYAPSGDMWRDALASWRDLRSDDRSEEHTSELQSLMRISYAVFCLKKKKNNNEQNSTLTTYSNHVASH